MSTLAECLARLGDDAARRRMRDTARTYRCAAARLRSMTLFETTPSEETAALVAAELEADPLPRTLDYISVDKTPDHAEWRVVYASTGEDVANCVECNAREGWAVRLISQYGMFGLEIDYVRFTGAFRIIPRSAD